MSTIEEAREQARAWVTRLRGDRDWARTPEIREARSHELGILVALLDATEPPEIQYADSATVAALAEKIAGENAELMDRLAVKPAEDEREALIERIAGTIAVPWLVSHGTTWGDLVQRSRDPYMRDAREVLRVVEAAGYSKGPRPITDEMVERAISAHRFTNAFGPEEVTRMRAALEAAEGARR